VNEKIKKIKQLLWKHPQI